MTGLVLRDILVLRKTLKTYLLFLLFYFIMALLNLFSIAFITRTRYPAKIKYPEMNVMIG